MTACQQQIFAKVRHFVASICLAYLWTPSGHMTFIQHRINVDATSLLRSRAIKTERG